MRKGNNYLRDLQIFSGLFYILRPGVDVCGVGASVGCRFIRSPARQRRGGISGRREV